MTKQNKETIDMIESMIGKLYDLEIIGTNTALEYVTMRPYDLGCSKLKKYQNVRLVNVNGLGTGQVHFITNDGSYLLLPWCYIVSMVPSKDGDQK